MRYENFGKKIVCDFLFSLNKENLTKMLKYTSRNNKSQLFFWKIKCEI